MTDDECLEIGNLVVSYTDLLFKEAENRPGVKYLG